MPTLRSAVPIASFLVIAAVGSAPSQAAVRDNSLEDLRKQAAGARSDLEKATRQMEDRRKQLAASQDQLRSKLKDLAAADRELDRIRGPLAMIANSSYQQPGAAGSMAIFGVGDPGSALRSTSDVTYLAKDQQSLVDRANALQKRRADLASGAQDLQARNAIAQTKIQQDVNGLKDKSARLTKQLTAMLAKVSPDRRLALTCDKSLAADAKKFPNGLIPAKYLCPLPQKGKQLRADAALAFYKMNTAYRAHFGRQMCVTDSYRSLANQQRVYAERPGFAAVPGTSNHGKGQAVDLCGGVQNQGSPQFNWLRANAKRFGWLHPAWAYSNPFEPWHWEFGTEGDQ
ncbi:D-alanyl-D-alanine carboxypeptidase family protein [Actinomadura parmotrematis]|uniref:D-alanyl-D-alanine carboxypeptidase family protein n=1 Tax=Actinomadura parmotrematis TaxID=2864039 RepID=A0ABS7FMW1_9ACTN|nr:D-alanyl-D-alanine carboxypeptidase family protein [Actinomadura parmotrematis]MBW8481715.1 D-alanyl-D-alanine carboxypeptidase family protein [Actinomadura parmotrematis]